MQVYDRNDSTTKEFLTKIGESAGIRTQNQ